MGANRLLILHAPQLNERLQQLQARLGESATDRTMLVRDPARVILRALFPDQHVPAAEINRGNRLLYALLSNEKFMTWAADYQQQLVRDAVDATKLENPEAALRAYLAITDRAKIHRDVAEAVARTADAEVIGALTWTPDSDGSDGTSGLPYFIWKHGPGPVSDVAVDTETFVYAVAAVAVFVVAVAAVVIEEPADGGAVSRVDIQTIANQITAGLQARGTELRANGALSSFHQRNMPYLP